MERKEVKGENPGDSNFVIHRMSEDDLDQVVALERKCDLDSRGVERYRKALSNPFSVLIVALSKTAQREVIGLLSAIVVLDEMQVDNIAVAPEWRRRGVASALIVNGLQNGRQKGALNAVLELRSANSAARALYECHGFIVAGQRPNYYHNPGDDGLIMTCRIVNSLAKLAEKNLDAL